MPMQPVLRSRPHTMGGLFAFCLLPIRPMPIRPMPIAFCLMPFCLLHFYLVVGEPLSITVCGRPTKKGRPCGWKAGQCPVHRGCEARDMGREDRRSRLVDRGTCEAPRCEQVRGECEFHATGAAQCASCLDGNPGQRCSLRREGGKFCKYHADFPDFGQVIQRYALACQRDGHAFSVAAFGDACYPGVLNLPPGNLQTLAATVLALPVPDSRPRTR